MIRTLFLFLSLHSILLTAAEVPSGHDLIEADYLDQFVLFQAKMLKVPPTSASDAAGAVDGIKNGKFGFHTSEQKNPWWQVDLGSATALGRVLVFNRLDYPSALANCNQIALSTSDDAKTWIERFRNDGKPVGGALKNDPLVISFPVGQVTARYVRLHIPSEKPICLFLDEVEVYGLQDPGKNLALNRPADQSSVSGHSVCHPLTPVEVQRVTWLKAQEHPGIQHPPKVDTSYLDAELLKTYGAECALRGLAQAERLAKGDAGPQGKISVSAAKLATLPVETPIEKLRTAYLELRWAIRAAVFKHPAWDVKELMFYTRRDGLGIADVSSISLPWAGSPGGDIQVLSLDPSGQTFGTLRPLLKGKLDPGHVHGFDLHFDAGRVVFGWTHGDQDFSQKPCRPGHNAFSLMGSGWIYELNLANGELRQITQGKAVHDSAPCYLADERIAFMSDRARSSMQCNQGQNEIHASIYACEADGKYLERLNNNITGDYNPRLLNDGRIGYLRWEYNERGFGNNHAFWAMRPDGTYAEPIFGQHVGNPIMFTNARNIPGSQNFMLIVSQHYNYDRGIIGVVDPRRGYRDMQAIRPLVPWTNWIGDTTKPTPYGWFEEPWPLAEDLVLCGYDYSPTQVNIAGYGIYLFDGSGNQELLFRDPKFSSHQPVPLRARQRPPVLPRTCQKPPVQSPDLSPIGFRNVVGEGVCILSDVKDGLDALSEPCFLRISENLVLPYFTQAAQTMYSDQGSWTPKRIIGDVPIEADGSAHFRLPADRALYFQLLDKDGREIRRMRSWVSLQAGETRFCTGCHEVRSTTARSQAVPLAARRAASTPVKRVSWGDKPVCYARDIRPILDRNCLECHSGLKPAKGLDFRDPAAAEKLRNLAGGSGRGGNHQVTRIREFGSAIAPLMSILKNAKHAESVHLNAQENIDLCAWVDLSAPIFDRCSPPYRYTPEGDIVEPEILPWKATNHQGPEYWVPPRKDRIELVSIDPVIKTIFQKRCQQCHEKPEMVLKPHWVDIQDPARSLFLVAPLVKTGGGTERCAGKVFANTQDPDYQSILTSLRTSVRQAWQNPDGNMMSLIEAGRMPAWATETTKNP